VRQRALRPQADVQHHWSVGSHVRLSGPERRAVEVELLGEPFLYADKLSALQERVLYIFLLITDVPIQSMVDNSFNVTTTAAEAAHRRRVGTSRLLSSTNVERLDS